MRRSALNGADNRLFGDCYRQVKGVRTIAIQTLDDDAGAKIAAR